MLEATTIVPETESLDVEALLARARAGDADAFCELCTVYEKILLRQAMVLCGNPGLAEELAEDTLVEAWRCLHRYGGRCQFSTWLCAILLNRYRNSNRSRRASLFGRFSDDPGDDAQKAIESVPDHTASPDQVVEDRDQAVLVQKCIGLLPRKHQEVIHLRFYVDDSLEGIAAALGCSVGTVKSRLFHALEKLRRMNVLNEQMNDLKIQIPIV